MLRFLQNRRKHEEGKLTTLSACLVAQLILSVVLSIWIEPGGESFALAFCIIGCLAMAIVTYTMAQATRACLVTLCIASLIMTFGAWCNIQTYTHDNFSLSTPDFHADDPFDSYREFTRGTMLTRGESIPAGAMNGNYSYPLMVSVLFRMFGVNIVWPMALNMGFTLGSIVLAGAICAKLMPDYGRRLMALCGMIMATAVSGILMHGTLLLKDAPTIFGVSLFAYSMALTVRGQFKARAICTAAAASLVLLFSRPMVCVFLLIGVVVVCLRFRGRDKNGSFGPAIYYALLMFAVLAAARSAINVPANIDTFVGDNNSSSELFLQLPTVKRYGSLLTGYYTWPMWRRVVYLPFVCAAQYFPPFPWNFTRDLWMGGFYWFVHIPVGWYVVGGLVIAYYVFCLGRKRGLKTLNRWSIWWLICYIGIGFYSAGTVPRYYLPFVPAAIPMAACVCHQVRSLVIPRKGFVIYCGIYLLLLSLGLTAAYIFLKG